MASTGRWAGFGASALVLLVAACGGKQTARPRDGDGGTAGQAAGGASAVAASGTNLGGAPGAAGALAGSGAGSLAGSSASGSAGAADLGGAGGADDEPIVEGDFARTGPFKALVYSRTGAYRHDGSIQSGKVMLQEIAEEQGFEVVMTETNELFTAANLAAFELVFFLNTSGSIFGEAEKLAFEDWMIGKHGAFVGVHSATDTEFGWAFYAEVTGQYFSGHGIANSPDDIVFELAELNHPAVKGLPNPWPRNEEWSKFDNYEIWQTKPGFRVLGRKSADGHPSSWIREWGNFRSFYSELGHDTAVFQDPLVKKHITGGIMWAVRREALIK